MDSGDTHEHEIMTLEEVAKFLRVSERTVYDWAQRGEIPCGKLGTSWRFKRNEIERWVDKRLGSASERIAPAPPDLHRMLIPERTLLRDFATKHEVIEALLDTLAQAPEIRNRDELSEAIYKRESLMSTGIGLGIGVPHVRLPSIPRPVMACARSRTPIADYESLDGQPVHLVFMIAAGSEQHAQYINLLSVLSSRLKNEGLRKELMAVGSPNEFLALLADGRIH